MILDTSDLLLKISSKTIIAGLANFINSHRTPPCFLILLADEKEFEHYSITATMWYGVIHAYVYLP